MSRFIGLEMEVARLAKEVLELRQHCGLEKPPPPPEEPKKIPNPLADLVG